MVNFVGPDKPWQTTKNYIDHLQQNLSGENLFLAFTPVNLKNSLYGTNFGLLAYIDGVQGRNFNS